VDSLPQVGGQINTMYPGKFIGDVAGFPAVRGRELVEALVAHAAPFSATYLLEETATSLNYGEDGCPEIRLSSGRTIHTKAVVITAGVGKFEPRPLPVGEEFLGHVSSISCRNPAGLLRARRGGRRRRRQRYRLGPRVASGCPLGDPRAPA
jgi:thioredoxin reductase (NADPH)